MPPRTPLLTCRSSVQSFATVSVQGAMWSRKCGSQGKEGKEDISDAGQPWHRREIHQSANAMKPELGCAQRRSGLGRAQSFSKVTLFSGVIWRWTAEELVCAQQLHKQLLLWFPTTCRIRANCLNRANKVLF